MKNKEKIAGFLLISLGILIALSLIHYNSAEPVPEKGNEVLHSMGLVGFWVSFYLIRKTIGYASYVFPLLAVIWGFYLTKKDKYKQIFKLSLYFLLFSFYIALATALFGFPKDITSAQVIEVCSKEPWGMIGGISYLILNRYFGEIGSYIVFFTLVIITILNIVDINFGIITNLFRKIFAASSKKIAMQTAKRKRKINVGKSIPESDILPAEVEEDEREYPRRGLFETEKPEEEQPPTPPPEIEEEVVQPPLEPEIEQDNRVYKLPSSTILDELPEKDEEVSWDEFRINAKTLEVKLADFGIQGKVIEINPGPIITRYEIEPAPGIKINRFTSLADDLALVMRAKRIRVVAPIPGKAAIGIEIPNRKPSIVYLKEVIDSPQFKSAKSVLSIALGKTIAGDIFITDLGAMPHLLIAGATGSGKSVCLNSIIISLLFKATPEEVQLVLIDPKRLELTPYAALKNHHLIYREDLNEEVVTSASNAVMVLKSLQREMERRYELLSRAGVRNIEDYNSWVNSAIKNSSTEVEKLPYIVLIIDELADLMLTAAREVEEPIARLTQMSRAVGIHLIVATQRPSVDVITGVIKANFPARMAFQVATKTDSRTILDMNGAEKLLGKGDMLFLPPASPEPIRIHNAYVSHEEVKRLIEYIRQQPPLKNKRNLITEEEMSTLEGMNHEEERDELFNEALKLVVRHQQGSSSLLQRRLKIGYTRAARIIDQLERAGFVGPSDGSKAREVLIDDEELREMGIV